MSDLVTVREEFVSQVGDTSLVLDDGSNEFNGSDNGANSIINRGIRRLVRLQQTLNKNQSEFFDVVQGQILVVLENIRVIRKVEIGRVSDETRSKMVLVTDEQMRKLYPARVTTKASGTITFTDQPLDTETFTVGTEVYTFLDSPSAANDIQIGVDLETSLDNATAKLVANSLIVDPTNTVTTLQLTDKTSGFEGNSIIFTETITNATINGSGFLGGTVSGSSADDSGRPCFYSFGLIQLGPNQYDDTRASFSGKVGIQQIDFTGANKKRGIIIAPAPDEDYTLRIIGSFYPVKLSADTDTNEWVLNHEDLVIESAKMVYYEDLNHTSNSEKSRRIIAEGLKSIDDDIIEMETEDTQTQVVGFTSVNTSHPRNYITGGSD